MKNKGCKIKKLDEKFTNFLQRKKRYICHFLHRTKFNFEQE